jgi:hypothetical protein
MSFRNFTTGNSHSFGGEYVEIVPHERLRYADKFDAPDLPGQIQVTVTLKKVSLGTELNIVQEGLPHTIPPEVCRCATWRGSSSQKSIKSEATQEWSKSRSVSASLPFGMMASLPEKRSASMPTGASLKLSFPAAVAL